MTESTNVEMLLTNVRLSYCYPEGYHDKQDPKKVSYPSHFLLATDEPQVPQIVAAMKSVARAQWGAKADEMYAALKAKDRLALHIGATSKPGEPDYEGKVFVSGNAKKPFNCIATRGTANVLVAPGAPDYPYSGAWANAKVAFYTYVGNKGPNRICCQIQGIQFVRHDTAFGGGGRMAAPDEFGVVATDADSAEPAQAGGTADLLG